MKVLALSLVADWRAGSVTAILLMNALKQAVWSLSDDRWSIFLAVMVGGLLIATLHTRGDGMTLSAQMELASHPMALKWRQPLSPRR